MARPPGGRTVVACEPDDLANLSTVSVPDPALPLNQRKGTVSDRHRKWLESTSGSSKASVVAFMENLLDRVPELAPVYAEHLREGEFLPDRIMSGVAVFAQDAQLAMRFLQGPVRNDLGLALTRLLDALEEGMHGGEQNIRELILDEFLGHLGENQYCEIYVDLADRLKPALAEGLERAKTSWRGPAPGV
jgi:hypothetical protein